MVWWPNTKNDVPNENIAKSQTAVFNFIGCSVNICALIFHLSHAYPVPWHFLVRDQITGKQLDDPFRRSNDRSRIQSDVNSTAKKALLPDFIARETEHKNSPDYRNGLNKTLCYIPASGAGGSSC
jgi:hypothetical protein